jgi:long-chain acyl-CoA synthetase
VKDLIISGGVNIYPAEIEAVLLRHPSVQDVAIIGIPNDEFGEEIKGFVELKPGATTTTRALLEFCAGALASYKHPRSLELTAKLPRNTMGKLLKRELREPFWRHRERKV